MIEEASPLDNRQIHRMMKQNKSYWAVKREVFKQLVSANLPVTQESILKVIQAQNHKEQLKNLITNCIEKNVKRVPLETDPLPEVEAVRLKWSDNILTSFSSVISKLSKEDEEEGEDESVNYVYDCLSFLDHIGKTKAEVGLRARPLSIYMFPDDIVKLPHLTELKNQFMFLNSPDNLTREKEALYREREKKAKKILDNDGFQNDIEGYLLHGSSNGERMLLYMKYFGIEPEQREVLLLQEDAKQNPHPIDKIFTSDMGDILNDPMYFIFRVEIKHVLRMFMRDKSIKDKVRIRPHTFNNVDPELNRQLPGNNIILCQLFAKLIAPFCYGSLKIDAIYSIFRQFYCEYFCLLQSISSFKNSALYLCNLFESLLDSSQRKLALHFSQLGVRPLQLVFPWIFYCFVGYVDIQQIFYILDRIVATKSLQILPLYAISLLYKEKAQILQVKSFDQIQKVLHKSMQKDVMHQTIRLYLAFHP